MLDAVFPPKRSSASTTTSARKPSRTSWPCGSPTRCSSRSGTAATSTTCRSRWPRTSGIGGRAGYYDRIGAARDVIQNHLLQLLALTAMEEPLSFAAEALRTEKEKVLCRGPDPGRHRDRDRARAVRRRVAGRDPGPRLPRGGRHPAGLDHRDLRRDAPHHRQPGAGPACRSTCAPASGCRARMTEIAVIFQRAPAPAVRRDRHRGTRPERPGHPGAAG